MRCTIHALITKLRESSELNKMAVCLYTCKIAKVCSSKHVILVYMHICNQKGMTYCKCMQHAGILKTITCNHPYLQNIGCDVLHLHI